MIVRTGLRRASNVTLGLFIAAGCTGAFAADQVVPQLLVVKNGAAQLPVQVNPYNREIRYRGRWDVRQKAGPRCQWSDAGFQFRFKGSSANVVINDLGTSNMFEVVVDGKPASVIEDAHGQHTYQVCSFARPGVHNIALYKRTEAFFGIAQLDGLQLSTGAKLLPLPRSNGRRIEVIGDSISCGYGDESKNQNSKFKAQTEDAYETYGAIAARYFGAEFSDIAWSGRKMWPDNTTPSIYAYSLPTDTNSTWDYSKWVPQAIIINLSTNDFNGSTPSVKDWTGGYEAFITRLRKHFPKAIIFVASSPMEGGSRSTLIRTYLHKIVADEHAKGDNRVHFMNYATEDPADGLGSGWHPSLKTHRIMASVTEAAITKWLGWKSIRG